MTTMSYQEQQMLAAATGRAAILNLNARHNRAYSDGDRDAWIATFRHSGATYIRDHDVFTDLRMAFDGGDNQRLVCVDHEIQVDGVHALQRCVAVLYALNVWGRRAAGDRDIPGRADLRARRLVLHVPRTRVGFGAQPAPARHVSGSDTWSGT